ncbi:MAG: TolC family protein [Campylobacterales bacterium]|nr:TolC family protein [Campylobacterales bacterium]
MKLLLPFLLTLTSTLWCASSDANLSTLDPLITRILETHPKLGASRMQIKASKSGVDGAKWGYYPTPSIDVGGGKNSSTLARLEQPLWAGGRIDATYNISVSKQHESEVALDENAYTLIDSLLQTVQNLTQARGRVHALTKGQKQLDDFNGMLNRRIEAGVSSLADEELIKSRLAQINTDLTIAKIAEKTACSQLRLITSEPDISCSLDADRNPAPDTQLSTDEMISQMLKTHPSVLKAAIQIQTAEYEKNKAKAALWPTVSLRAEYQKGSVYTNYGAENSIVYLSAQMNPGAGLSSISGIEASEATIQQLKFNKLTLEQELTQSLLRDIDDHRSALDRVQGTNLSIDASQKVLESYTRLFLAGKRQWLDLVNSSKEVTQNRINLEDLLATATVSTYRLKLKTGELIAPLGKQQ